MGHGKTTLVDCLAARSGLVGQDKVGETMVSHLRKDEQENNTSKKAALLSMLLPNEADNSDKNQMMLHLMDTPGHPEFSPEVSSTLRCVDGCVLVVDTAEGNLPVPAEMALGEAVRAGVR